MTDDDTCQDDTCQCSCHRWRRAMEVAELEIQANIETLTGADMIEAVCQQLHMAATSNKPMTLEEAIRRARQ